MKRSIFSDRSMIPVDEFIGKALYDEGHGYYMTNVPFGKRGDFITAPDISQLFGETIALWLLRYLEETLPTSRIILVELGPGNGTLMSDILRVVRKFPHYDKLLEVHLVEVSPLLRKVQENALSEVMAQREIFWHSSISELPEGPVILIANEFFDALPVKQFVLIDGVWHENYVRCSEKGEPEIVSIRSSRNFPQHGVSEGGVIEICEAAISVMETIVKMLTKHGGAGVIVDYGYLQPVYKSTIQAVKDHRYCDFLSNIGKCDISACVDFNALRKIAGNISHEVLTQREFLYRFGIRERLEMLVKNATEEQATNLRNSYLRLTENMGTLFKVMMLYG